MALTDLYKLSYIVTPAGTIHQLEDRSIDPGLQEVILKGDGKVSPQYFAIMEQRPAFRFSTTAIASVLTKLGSGFYPFTSAVDLYLAKLSNSGGGIAAGAVHKKVTGTKGCIVPRRLRASHGGVARLECDGYFVSTDGTTAPISVASGVSLPTAVHSDEGFTLGPAKINGSMLGALQDLDIEFGYQQIIEGGDGELYPTFGGYDTRAPRVSIRTKDPSQLATLGVLGLAASGSNLFYLRKMDQSLGRVANATAQHIKLTMTTGFHKSGAVDEDDNKESGFEFTSTPTDDGTNDILAISLASAIA
jgi:hypothetical protein